MSHIFSGSASENEVRNFIGGRETVIAYAKEQDSAKTNYYEFWSDIVHPETGERLTATKGYCNPNDMNQCYYAEYIGEDGRNYYYLDSRYFHGTPRGTKSISEQQNEDRQEWKSKCESQKHQDFFASERRRESSSEQGHKQFFESSSSPHDSTTQASGNDNGNSNNQKR